MITDELERTMLERYSQAESLQAWAQQVRDTEQHDRHPLRVLLPVGKRLMAFGSKLTERFGIPA